MRRMYSQAELSAIIKEVFLEDVASGQIDLPALIEEALPEVDVVAKTLYQTESNWSLDIDFSSLQSLPANCVVSNVYSKITQWNRELHIVFNFIITNNGETQSSAFNSFNNYITLPEEIASKIIDFENKSAHESSFAPICGGTYNLGSTAYPTALEAVTKPFVILNASTPNVINIGLSTISAINPGGTLYISGRISLDL